MRPWMTRSVIGVTLAAASGALFLVVQAGAQSSGSNTLTTIPGSAGSVTPTTSPPTNSTTNSGDSPNLRIPYKAPPTPIALSRTSAPRVSISGTECNASEIHASVIGFGPYFGMGSTQLIVNLTANHPCSISGFPSLRFSNTQPLSGTRFIHGGIAGTEGAAAPVELGTIASASFLIQFAEINNCQSAQSLFMKISNSSTSIRIGLGTATLPKWQACAIVNVTPFEQGNGIGRYA